MCVGIPGEVVEVKGGQAKTKQEGHSHWVDISTIQGEVKKGDYLLTYLDAAVNKVTVKEAAEIFELMNSAGDTRVKSAD